MSRPGGALIAPGWRSTFERMPVKLLRQTLALLIVTAYVGATMFQVAPTYAANADMSSAAMNGMMHEQDGQGDKMPCKGMLPGCITELGCIFLVSLPSTDLTLVTVTAWSSVIYDNASEGLPGRTIKPALGPPISFA
jgi:hypothetical protein